MQQDLQTQIGARIKAILAQKGLKQQDLVKMTGISKSYISQIIHGTVNITAETIQQLEKALQAQIVQIPK